MSGNSERYGRVGRMAVHVEGLTVDYDTCRALDGVTFDLPAGALLAVFGENGSGKTTLLQAVAGLLAPSAGCVVRTSTGVTGLAGHLPMLYEELTIRENLEWTARLYGMPAGSARIEDLLARAGLAELAGRTVGRLSRGQVQRVTLVRALLPQPGLLILDEPFSHLDDAARAGFETWLGEIQSAGKTCLLATHGRASALKLATHVLTLASGRIGYYGDRAGYAG